MGGTSFTNESLADLLFIIFIIGLIYLIIYFILLIATGLAAKVSKNYLARITYQELKKFPLIIWLAMILLTVTQLPVVQQGVPIIMKTVTLISAFILFTLLGNLINKILRKYFNHKARKVKDPQKAHFYKYISLIVRVSVWFACFVIILGLAGVDINGFFAFLGLSSLGLSFAMRNTIKDGLNSFIIVFQKPFEIGDYVRNVDSYGKVEQVGLKNTRLTTIDNKSTFVPNSWLMDKPLTNFKNRDNIKVKYEMVISTPKLGRYERKIMKAKRKIYQLTDLIEANSLELVSKSITKEEQVFDIILILDLDNRSDLDNVNRDLMHSIFKIFKDQGLDVEEIKLDEKPSPFAR